MTHTGYQRAMTCLQVLSEYLLKVSKELFQTKILKREVKYLYTLLESSSVNFNCKNYNIRPDLVPNSLTL